MDTKENWNLEPLQENHAGFEEFDGDDDDDDEALSLCDLALNSSNVSDWDDSSKEDQTSSFDQDLFEFFSEDFTTTSTPKDNIIFCGKLIPYKDDESVQNLDHKAVRKLKEGKRSCIFPWKSFSLNKNMQQEKSFRTCKSTNTFPESLSENKENGMQKYVNKRNVPKRKVSLMASQTRSKWYLFAFGVGRYPMEMELNDIKTRQSKLNDNKMQQSSKTTTTSTTPGKKIGFGSDDRRRELDGKRRKSWWSLLRILGCRTNHANAMVKASLGLLPLPSE